MRRTKAMMLVMDNMAGTIKKLSKRIDVLECEHTPEAVEGREAVVVESGGGMSSINTYTVWFLKCSKCGKRMGSLTEIEYLELSLERDRNSFLGTSEVMKARLEELKAKEAADEV